MKDQFESTYQLLINWWEKVGTKKLKNPKAFIVYSQAIDDVYENLGDYNPRKKRRVVTVFDDIIADIESNKKSNPIVSEIVFKRKNLNIPFIFISKSYFKMPKIIILNATHYFIMKITNKSELEQIASNHLSDIDFKDFMKLFKDYTKELYSWSVNDTTF